MTAREELDQFLAIMPIELKSGIETAGIPLGDIPVDTMAFGGLLDDLSSEIRSKFEAEIKQLKKLNSLVGIAEGNASHTTISDSHAYTIQREYIESTFSTEIAEELNKHTLIKIKDSPPTFLVVHSAENQFKIATVTTVTLPKGVSYQQLNWGTIIFNSKFKEIHATIDPFNNETKYAVNLIDPNGIEEPIGPLTLPNLILKLKGTRHAFKTGSMFDESISQAITAYHNAGEIKYREEIEQEGFFCIKGKLVASKFNYAKPSQEQAKSAIRFIHGLKQFYSGQRNERLLAHMLKLGIVAPFSFARRQMGYSKNDDWIPGLDLFGHSGAGKTYGTDAILNGIWGRVGKQGNVVKSGSVMTESRLALNLRSSTFPVMLTEVDWLADTNNTKIQPIVSALKNAIEFAAIRNINTVTQEGKEQYALACIIITRNSTDKIEDSGFGNRYVSFEFTTADKKTPEQKVSFNDFVSKNIADYAYLGQFAADYILAHPECLNQRWDKIGRDVLKAFCESAGIEYPQWLDLVIENTNNADANNDYQDTIRRCMQEDILSAYKNCKDKSATDLISKFDLAIKEGVLPGYYLVEGKIRIDSTIKESLKKKGAFKLTIKNIAEICGFEYKQNAKKGKCVGSAIEIDRNSFIRFIMPETEETLECSKCNAKFTNIEKLEEHAIESHMNLEDIAHWLNDKRSNDVLFAI